MEIGFITPVAMTEYSVTKIHYCLPSFILSSESYRDFFKSKREDTVIMDIRQPGWNRKPEDLDTFYKALEVFTPSLIILPSYAFSKKKTLDLLPKYLKDLPLTNLVACLEGTTFEEVKAYAEGVKALGVTRFAVPSHLYRLYRGKGLKNGIFIDNHLTVMELVSRDGILVTSLPVRLGLQGRLLQDFTPSPPSLTFTETEDVYPMVIKRNIEDTLKIYKKVI
jgi:hypothetical protein